MKIYRQGDVLLVEVAEIPVGAKPLKAKRGRYILAYGEATGHHHSVAIADAEAFRVGAEPAEEVYLRIMAETPLTHQEHGAITLPPGVYRRVLQREYEPGELPRRVLD